MSNAVFIIDKLNKDMLKNIPHYKDLLGRIYVNVNEVKNYSGFIGNISKVLYNVYDKIRIEKVV